MSDIPREKQCLTFKVEPGQRVQFTTPTGAHYLTNAQATMHRVRRHELVDPEIVCDFDKPRLIGGKPNAVIRDAGLEFVTGNKEVVAVIREREWMKRGWTPFARYCREGGRLVLVDVVVE